jgi:hypothetical protein
MTAEAGENLASDWFSGHGFSHAAKAFYFFIPSGL